MNLNNCTFDKNYIYKCGEFTPIIENVIFLLVRGVDAVCDKTNIACYIFNLWSGLFFGILLLIIVNVRYSIAFCFNYILTLIKKLLFFQ